MGGKISVRPLFYIVLLNLVLKMAVFFCISPWQGGLSNTKVMIGDTKGYEQVAENLMKYHTFAPKTDTVDIKNFSEYRATGYIMCHPDGWMMPVYPIFMAVVYSITGIKPFMVILVQIILSLISVVFVYRICQLLFKNDKIAALAALLYAVDIHSNYVANQLLTDTIFTILFLAGVYYSIKGSTLHKFGLFCIGALFIGLACLTRLLALFYPLVLLFILFVFVRQSWIWKIKLATAYLLIITCMNGLWVLRNHSAYNHWAVTTHGDWTLLMFNVSLTRAHATHENLDSVRVAFQRQADSMGFRKLNDIFEQSSIYKQIATQYIKQHKGTYLLTTMEGCLNMFLSLGNMGMAKTFGWTQQNPSQNFAELSSQRISKNFSSGMRETMLGILIMLIMAVEYIGAVYGMIKLFIARNYMVLSLVILTIAYYAGVTGILGMYRFKVPVVPFICLAAAYGYYRKKNLAGSIETIV